MIKGICMAIMVGCILFIIGTSGAIETGTINEAHGWIRIGVFIAIMCAAFFGGRVYELEGR